MIGTLAHPSDPPAPPLRPGRPNEAERRAVRAAGALTSGPRNASRCLRHTLRIGTTRRDGRVAGHAWIEVLGGRIDTDGANSYGALRPARPPDDHAG